DGDATISSNIGTLTAITDATYAISSTPAVGRAVKIKAAATASDPAIDFNGGTYNVLGDPMTETLGTFRSTIDGVDGTITFNAASINADIIKAGSFGDNGVLKIGGGSLNANTMLKLYATGSNGLIDFVKDVILSIPGESNQIIIAATTVRIEPGVTVTVTTGMPPASVYTDHANFNTPGFGSFAGQGVFVAGPTASAPPFDDTIARATKGSRGGSATAATSPGVAPTRTPSGNAGGKKFVAKAHGNIPPAVRDGSTEHRGDVRVADTNQLIELMDNPAAFAMMDRRRSPAEIKRSALGLGKDHSSGSARGSPSGANQLRDPRGQMARP
ncbi:MAG TPA: hypothetical protein VGM62_13645, partial [Chthoniobacterales bacterium]